MPFRGRRGKGAAITARIRPCTSIASVASSDQSDGGAPLYSPIEESFTVNGNGSKHTTNNKTHRASLKSVKPQTNGVKINNNVNGIGKTNSVVENAVEKGKGSTIGVPAVAAQSRPSSGASSNLNPSTKPFVMPADKAQNGNAINKVELPTPAASSAPTPERASAFGNQNDNTTALLNLIQQTTGSKMQPLSHSQPQYNCRPFKHETYRQGLAPALPIAPVNGTCPRVNGNSPIQGAPAFEDDQHVGAPSMLTALNITSTSGAASFNNAHSQAQKNGQTNVGNAAGRLNSMSTQVPHTAVNNNAGYQNGVSTYVQSAQGNGTPRGNTNYQQAIYQNDVVKNGNTGGHDYFRFKTPPPVIQPLVLDVPKKTIELFAAPTKEIMAQRSVMLNRIVGEDGRPTLESLMDPENFPFIEPAIVQSAPKDYGVVHLSIQIPYNSSRAEIVAFLGRNSRILNDNEEPVHIIMDRVTSKTNDAYVEFVTLEDAINAVNRIKNNMLKGRCARLGERPVDIEVSSQSALMKDLFPIARGLRWNGSRPEFKQPNPKEPWDNFKTFVTAEEMCMLVKHVEVPNRSPFSRDCPERAYECLISTIKKMPWYTTECITIKQRHDIYEACAKLIENLKMNIHDGRSPERLNETLQKRLVQAAMLCPGFTVVQKDSIASLVNMPDMELRSFNMPRYPDLWTHQYTLGPKPGIPLDVLEYYIAIIREETTRAFATLSIREKQSLYSRGNNGYWGFFWREIAFPTGETFDELTLAEAAEMEWDTIDRIIRRAVDIAYGGTGSEYSPRKGKEPLQITDGSTNGNGLMLQGANGDGVSLHW